MLGAAGPAGDRYVADLPAKRQNFAVPADSDKRYRVIARLGQRIDTFWTPMVKSVQERPVTFSVEQFASALETFVGISNRTSMYSGAEVSGQEAVRICLPESKCRAKPARLLSMSCCCLFAMKVTS